jgi:hypothetical protein
MREEKLTELLGVARQDPQTGLPSMSSFASKIRSADRLGNDHSNPLEPWPGTRSSCRPPGGIRSSCLPGSSITADFSTTTSSRGTLSELAITELFALPAGSRRKCPARETAADRGRYGCSMLQLACLWNLAHEPVASVVPTLIQEVGAGAKPIETKLDELAALPEVQLAPEEVRIISSSATTKVVWNSRGPTRAHNGEPLPDRWPLNNDLRAIAQRWHITPEEDLVCTHHSAA